MPLRVPQLREQNQLAFLKYISRRTFIVGSITAVLCAIIVSVTLGRDNNTALETSALATSPPNPIATATPSCSSAIDYLDIISRHEQAGQWQTAVKNAEIGAQDPELCAKDRAMLEAKIATDGLEALFGQTFDPGYLAQQSTVTDYYQLKRRAEKNGLPFVTNLQVFQRAYQVSLFLLAKAAAEDAYRAGEFSPENQLLVQRYTSTLHNMGKWWATQPQGEARAAGLALLVASYHVDVRYHVGSGAAWGVLRELLGPDEQLWPQPAITPLLETLPHARLP
jgi:hypothetical protein